MHNLQNLLWNVAHSIRPTASPLKKKKKKKKKKQKKKKKKRRRRRKEEEGEFTIQKYSELGFQIIFDVYRLQLQLQPFDGHNH